MRGIEWEREKREERESARKMGRERRESLKYPEKTDW